MPNIMNLEIQSIWYVELNEVQEEVRSIEELNRVIGRLETLRSGRLWVGRDGGQRPWWQRFLGAQPRYVDALFSLEWFDQYACLIFYDERWSEYRVRDDTMPVFPVEEVRSKISHGELQACSVEECMKKDRAIAAIQEFVDHGSRPNWLKYRYVA